MPILKDSESPAFKMRGMRAHLVAFATLKDQKTNKNFSSYQFKITRTFKLKPTGQLQKQ